MSDIPRPGSRNHPATKGLDLENLAGLTPLHMEPPTRTTGLRPLGQVDGLHQLEPSTTIFPSTTPTREQPQGVREQARRLATSLDWNASHDE